MGTAFENEQYLIDWKEKGIYPKIHEDMFTLFSTTFECDSVLDMCCCTGLLGTHVNEFYGIPVVGLEGNPTWIERGRKHGVSIPILEIWISKETLPEILEFIKENKVNGMLARRCMAELFAYDKPNGKILMEPDMEWAKFLTESFVEAGIKEVWMEGGRPHSNTDIHPCPTTATGIKFWEPAYKVSEWHRQCVYMVAS